MVNKEIQAKSLEFGCGGILMAKNNNDNSGECVPNIRKKLGYVNTNSPERSL